MKRAQFYKTDWFIALLIGLFFAAAMLSTAPFLERFEYLAYDAAVRLTPRGTGEARNIAIIAIDETSIEQLGRWPWPRSRLAGMIEHLARVQPKAIGLLLPLSEPQIDPGLAYIREMRMHLARAQAFKRPQSAVLGGLRALAQQAEKAMDADGTLARALPRVRSNLYLAMQFKLGDPHSRPDGAVLPEFVQRQRFGQIISRSLAFDPLRAQRAIFPLAAFGEQAAGIGHLNTFTDSDGKVRSTVLAVEYSGEYYPALPLLLAARSLDLDPSDMVLELGSGVRLGMWYIETDGQLRLRHGFYASDERDLPFIVYSFYDVLAQKVPVSVFRDKLVLIGVTAPGAGEFYATPVSPALSSVEMTANAVAALLNRDYYTRPVWSPWVEAGAFLFVLVYLMFVLPHLRTRPAMVLLLLLFFSCLAAGQYLMASERIWLKSVSPALLLLTGHLVIGTKRLLQSARRQDEAELDSVQTHRLLGLAYQSQGQLDMAMDKFRRLPVDESVLELIYNLARDFERRREFNKAAAAYDYILGHDAKFRDAAERKRRAVQAGHSVSLGARITPRGILILEGGKHPTLGRYEVIQELGKGAMGTVYLGRDPMLNRMVAIKALALSQEFEAAELDQVKARFFREAEIAGRLNHPNIVTIYDAGEEHDLAYIAMEYLPGKNLAHYLAGGEPLPLTWVLNIGIRVADALAYAHKNAVVHRDIKPANVMYNEGDDTLKITDFGIARITAASRTRTGVILGTPSYMSPEQLTGRHVDGRSDLFSLGVMLFELVTGQQPFTSDSLATLMYQIANQRHPDVSQLRPDTPPCLGRVINRALQKDPNRRYACGDEMRADLEQCLKRIAPNMTKEGKYA